MTYIDTGLQSDWKLCVAPMMEWTDRHCRQFHRMLTPHARLYTEMVSTGALLHGPRQRLLGFSAQQHPLALQLGGSDPSELAQCAALGADAGFDEINLNVGCPSDRVQHARIGACLMREPDHVAECVTAMREATDVPITVKCRTGVDERDDYDFLRNFVAVVANAGCRLFIVHARKAILRGLSPAQNRTVPPLDWTRVSRLKIDFPHLTFVVNGGLDTLPSVRAQLRCTDGAMIGRAAYHNPWLLAELEHELYGTPLPTTRRDVLTRLVPYVENELERGTRLNDVARHLHGLFSGCPGARHFRRHLADHANRAGAGIDVLIDAAAHVTERRFDETMARCSNG